MLWGQQRRLQQEEARLRGQRGYQPCASHRSARAGEILQFTLSSGSAPLPSTALVERQDHRQV